MAEVRFGQIAKMLVSDIWKLVDDKSQGGNLTVSSFETKESDPDTEFTYISSSEAVSGWTACNFLKLLLSPPHKLSSEEFESVSQIAGVVGARDRFQPHRMETVDLNGRRVLVVEGNCIEEQVKGLFIFINASGDGYLADQMLFLAPENTFAEYLPSVQSAITSIEWVPSVPVTMPEISELEKFALEEASQFDDPATFPPKESVYGVMTLPDGSFEAYIRKGPPMFSQSKIHCPKKTKLHEYIASFKDQILS